MKTNRWMTPLCTSLLVLAAGARADGARRLGVGVHYWTTVDDVSIDNVDEDGVAWIASFQYWPTLVGVELAVESFESGFAGAGEEVYQPQAFVLVGGAIYGAAGIGGYYSDGEWSGDSFYVLRAGLNLELLPRLYLDINGNYRFEEWSEFETADITTDTVTLGAAARLAF